MIKLYNRHISEKLDNKPKPKNQILDKPVRNNSRNYIKLALVVATLIVLLIGSYAGYIYASSPEVIRKPKFEHYHFRMQILVDSQAENFAEDKYQQDYNKNQCNANLSEQPIHFHDGKDQFTHIHWEGMTGGMVMKYYGWNYIGGINNALGYKLDNLRDIQKVNTHGNFLPAVSNDAKFYIYTGNENSYKEKSFDDWKSQDLEQFFEKTSNSPTHEQNIKTSLLDKLLPKASAHGTADDEDGNDGSATDIPSPAPPSELPEEERLTRINNLIGNVVIFVQKDKPTDQQIKDRFSRLEPLSDSTCGG